MKLFIPLLRKELKYQFTNATYYIFLAVIVLFYVTQFDPPRSIADMKPLAPEEAKAQGKYAYYGQKPIADPDKEMAEMVRQLERDYANGEMMKAVVFINKFVKLDEAQKASIKRTSEAIAPQGAPPVSAGGADRVSFAVGYDEYLRLMRNLDKELGGSTVYGDKMRASVLNEPRTYEEAVQDFNDVVEKDKVTNAGGRLFADYMGITAGFFPVFLSAFMLARDKRSRMQELIYSRKFASFHYVLPKFAALCLAVLFGYLALATHATFAFSRIALAEHLQIDVLAFYKYTIAWLLPTVMVTVAAGMLVSVLLTYALAAIPIQFLLWMSSMMPLEGEYGLSKFVIRYNTFGGYENYAKWSSAILVNRIFYAALALAIVAIVAWIWDRKRGNAGAALK
ncbi:hypothetical protein [Paenibacillus sp. MBLB4367]|uniref:hypothetical protein n=1 Tax=Paenibacillus sp. MBLB4367 TaxID=3384767 RepID=UPI0039082E47